MSRSLSRRRGWSCNGVYSGIFFCIDLDMALVVRKGLFVVKSSLMFKSTWTLGPGVVKLPTVAGTNHGVGALEYRGRA